jgi:hypothetical protein
MLVRSQCLHHAVAKEYAERCRSDPDFYDFLKDTLPLLNLDQCSQCNPSCPSCEGENSEYHPNPSEFISGLEMIENGLVTDFPNYIPRCTPRQLKLLSLGSTLLSEDLFTAIPPRKRVYIDLNLLTGDPGIDRFQVADALRDREEHSHDDYSLQQELDEGLRVA